MRTRGGTRTRQFQAVTAGLRAAIAASLVVAATAVAVGCGGVEGSVSCRFDDSCGDASPADTLIDNADTGATDAPPPADTGACVAGDIKQVDCRKCVCDAAGIYQCTGSPCPDAGPPPTACPKLAPHGEACVGGAHCIYDKPCLHGCDCVAGAWTCVACPP